MAEILRIEHENEVLTQKNSELEEQLATYKAKVAEYAGIVKELRRDMEGMARIIDELKGGK